MSSNNSSDNGSNNKRPLALVDGFADRTFWHKGPVYRVFQQLSSAQTLNYFQWHQHAKIGAWIKANGHDGVVLAHSYGAHDVMRLLERGELHLHTLVTVDPVGRRRPRFSQVAQAVIRWVNIHATHQHSFADLVAFIGGKYGDCLARVVERDGIDLELVDIYRNHANVFSRNLVDAWR